MPFEGTTTVIVNATVVPVLRRAGFRPREYGLKFERLPAPQPRRLLARARPRRPARPERPQIRVIGVRSAIESLRAQCEALRWARALPTAQRLAAQAAARRLHAALYGLRGYKRTQSEWRPTSSGGVYSSGFETNRRRH